MNKLLLCISFLFLTFIATSQTADFSYQTNTGLFCSPSVIQFTQAATGNPTGYVWNFGDGNFSNSANPTNTYNKPGTYTVELIAIYQRNTAVVTKTIVINPAVTATIGFDRNYICTPGVINFTAGSNGNINSFEWDFGDGSIESANTTAVTHNYAALGNYNVTMKATDVSGCFGAASTSIKVQIPPLSGSASPVSGCVPANPVFVANATIPKNSTVTSYVWNFGDGSAGASTISNRTNHVYSTPGGYSSSVTITTSEGCTNSFTYPNVSFGTPPFNLTAYPIKPVICGSDSAFFVAKAVNANRYSWNFGDGSTQLVADTITTHKYKTLGIKNITVTPFFNGCAGTPATFQIEVVGVIAIYNFSNTCADKKTFSFNNLSLGNLSSVLWNFGDSSLPVDTKKAVHTFPVSGSFFTYLRVVDSITGCSDSSSNTIFTSMPSLVNNDTSICRNSMTTFSLQNNIVNPSATYTWQVVGIKTNPVKDVVANIKASVFGNFDNYVIINPGNTYCPDTIKADHRILVKGPNLSFNAPPSLCYQLPFEVMNASKPYIPSDAISTWYWNFGVDSTNDSSYQPKPFIYKNPGTYKVKLFGIDINGCYDTLVKPVTVNALPFLRVIPNSDTLCQGESDTLIAFHNEKLTWSPSNYLSCNTCDTVAARPLVSTQYIITAVNRFGCTTTDSVFIKVIPDFAASTSSPQLYLCLNDTVKLNVDPPMKRIMWSRAEGLSNTTNYNVSAFPKQSTIYTATLTDSLGCFTHTVDIDIKIKSLPLVNAGPDQVLPYNFSFSINPVYSNNITSYLWSPNNTLNCATCPNPGGVALNTVPYVIKVTSDSGCIASDSITIFIECKDANLLMPNAFTPNNDNLNDYFYPLSRGIKIINRFSIYDRFGKLVFEAKNFQPNNKAFGWDGRRKNMDLSTEVFVYYIEAECDLGQKLFKRGTVVLVR